MPMLRQIRWRIGPARSPKYPISVHNGERTNIGRSSLSILGRGMPFQNLSAQEI